jgi:hypothetical protein
VKCNIFNELICLHWHFQFLWRPGFQRNMRHQMHDQYLQALNAGRLQQQQQGSVEALSNACRLPPLWRTNHIFASSYTDECPSELIPGAWMHPGKVNGVGGMLPLTAEVGWLGSCVASASPA